MCVEEERQVQVVTMEMRGDGRDRRDEEMVLGRWRFLPFPRVGWLWKVKKRLDGGKREVLYIGRTTEGTYLGSKSEVNGISKQ